jgi:hypothetical protein
MKNSPQKNIILKNELDFQTLSKGNIRIDSPESVLADLKKGELVELSFKNEDGISQYEQVFNSNDKIICWWSGGITSAVACKISIDLFGKDNCQVIMIDTKNEHPDTYRFKKDCLKMVQDNGIEVPIMYKLGFQNNNCFNTGCVQGGIGYWQKMKIDFPDKFSVMADLEHELTELKGEPVTMLKDQGKEAKEKAKTDKKLELVFLKPHPDYPDNKCLDDMKGRPVEPLFDCNGMCGVNDLSKRKETEKDINYQD